MEKLPGWAKWLILLAGVAGIAAAALWLNDYVSRVDQLAPNNGYGPAVMMSDQQAASASDSASAAASAAG